MRHDLDMALCKDFPKLFSDRNAPITQSCFGFGFECRNGWEPIIRAAAQKLEAINDKIDRPEFWIRVSQIKEKFGTLRFYTGSILYEYADEVEAIINEVETKSETTCEKCGEEGKLRGTGWLSTECDSCAEGTPVWQGEQ
jgi:hypothetical protein